MKNKTSITIENIVEPLIKELPVGLALIKMDDDFSLLDANDYFYNLLETDINDYSEGLFTRFGNADRIMYTNYLKNQMASGDPVMFDLKTVKKKTDELVWIKIEAKTVSDKLYLAVVTDITKEKKLSTDIDMMKNIYLKAISSSDEIIFEYKVKEDTLIYYKMVEVNGNVVNEPFVRDSFLKNLSSSKDVYPDDIVYFYDLCRDNISHPFDVRFRRNGQVPGEYTKMRVHATIQKDGEQVARIIGTIRPIEVVKPLSQQLKTVSDKDELTGVNSRTRAKYCIEEYLLNSKVASSFALMILDIRDFKRVNDTFGHLFGDNVLIQVADCIIENIGRNDVVGRLGGDEFIIFTKNTSVSAANSIMDKICRGVRNIYVGEDISIDASIGAVVLKDPSKTYDELLQTADNELFELIREQKTGYRLTDKILDKLGNGLRRSYVADRNIRTVVDSKEKRLSELIFELLEQAKDMDRAMDTVLGLVGEKKNLSRISILKRDGDQMLVTRQWLSRGIKANKDLEGIPFIDYHKKMQSNFSEDGMGVITLDTAKRYNPDIAMNILSQDAKSIMYCNMMEFGQVVGVIAFVDCKEEREWTDIDYKAYRTITRMISAYTLKAQVYNASKDQQ